MEKLNNLPKETHIRGRAGIELKILLSESKVYAFNHYARDCKLRAHAKMLFMVMFGHQSFYLFMDHGQYLKKSEDVP